MPSIVKKSFSAPDESRTPEKTVVETVGLGPVKVARFTMEPGWRWSACVKPVVGTESCQQRHLGAVLSGRIHLSHTDGTEADFEPGDAYVIEPGHDAWVIGGEPFVAVEFEPVAAEQYGRRTA